MGTREGGLKASETNIKKYGEDFYRVIGSAGGKSVASKNRVWARHPDRARQAAKVGGSRPKPFKGYTREQWRAKKKDLLGTYKLSTKDLEEI